MFDLQFQKPFTAKGQKVKEFFFAHDARRHAYHIKDDCEYKVWGFDDSLPYKAKKDLCEQHKIPDGATSVFVTIDGVFYQVQIYMTAENRAEYSSPVIELQKNVRTGQRGRKPADPTPVLQHLGDKPQSIAQLAEKTGMIYQTVRNIILKQSGLKTKKVGKTILYYKET